MFMHSLCLSHFQTCVNQIYRGKVTLPSTVPFGQLLDDFDGSYSFTRKYYPQQPHMIKVNSPTWAFLLFPSGKYRLIFKTDASNVKFTLDFIIRVLLDNNNAVAPNNYKLQSETFTLSLPFNVNLQLYKEANNTSNSDLQYEPELFPALRLNWYPPVMINLFHTGKVVIMGRKARHYLDIISMRLHNIDSKFTF